ncbi:MAG TPA: hypothetical protein VHM20_01030, partial [Gammaproteobacteria bacterium]|nr:hypothetical protein [Gammaproteobacteria bacterium]
YSFNVPRMSQFGVSLSPKPYIVDKLKYNSRILGDLHSVWDITKFRDARTPVELCELSDTAVFKRPVTRVLDMPIKLAGSNDYKIPSNILPFQSIIQTIINHEHSILSEEQLRLYHAYLTIDQSYVTKGLMQRKPGAHVDGFQGSRINPKTIINHSYVVSNGTPTVFYPQSFKFSHLDERVHNFFLAMDAEAMEEKAIRTKPYTLYLMDAYTVHRADIAIENCFRTFLRISYDVKEFDRLGNTINPMFSYAWEMVPREAQSTLVHYQLLTDKEKDILSRGDSVILSQYMTELKKFNLDHYYNFSYFALHSENINLINIVLLSLANTNKPTIQELRLMFVIATNGNVNIAAMGKKALLSHLQLAKLHIENHLFLDFVLEMIMQSSKLLPKKFLAELIKGNEQTPQGKEIIKNIAKHFNPVRFWKKPDKTNERQQNRQKFTKKVS